MNWKHCERKIAQLVGGKRVPVSGRHEQSADIEHPALAIEVKARKQLPAWLLRAMEQAEASADDGRIPVVVLHQSGDRYTDSIALLRLGDLQELMNRSDG